MHDSDRLRILQVVHQLHIPCVNTKFMTPVFNMQSTEFFRIWQVICYSLVLYQSLVHYHVELVPATKFFGVLYR